MLEASTSSRCTQPSTSAAASHSSCLDGETSSGPRLSHWANVIVFSHALLMRSLATCTQHQQACAFPLLGHKRGVYEPALMRAHMLTESAVTFMTSLVFHSCAGSCALSHAAEAATGRQMAC